MSDVSPKGFPVLREGEMALLQADCMTGHVLTPTGELAIGDAERYLTFPSLDSARQYARQRVTERPLIECHIYDSRRVGIDRVRNEEAIANPRPPKRPESWWQRLLSWRGRRR
jgi:hypothetical protein